MGRRCTICQQDFLMTQRTDQADHKQQNAPFSFNVCLVGADIYYPTWGVFLAL